MAGFLQNLLLSGARPVMRAKGLAGNIAPLREMTDERAASVAEAPQAVPIIAPTAAPRPTPTQAEVVPETRTAPERPEPPAPAERSAAEIGPAAANAEPDAASEATLGTAKPADHALAGRREAARRAEPPHQDREEAAAGIPAERPVVERRPEPPARAPAIVVTGEQPVAQSQPRAAERLPVRRMPAPVHVEAAPPKEPPVAAAHLMAPRDVRPPERPLPVSRVEFAAAGKPVSVLAKPGVQDRVAQARDLLPRSRPAAVEVAPVVAEPRPSPAPPREPPARSGRKPDAAEPAPAVRQNLQAPPPTAAPAARREYENTISIRQLDIQIVAEEPRRAQGRNRPQSIPAGHGPDRLSHYYVREVS